MAEARRNDGIRAILLGPLLFSWRDQKAVLSRIKIKSNDLLIGVDGGTQIWKKLGYRPHFAVGDWDSLKSQKVLAQIPHISLSPNKDRSDLFYAVKAAISFGAKNLVCLGVTGGRVDHQMAMILDLSSFSAKKSANLKQIQVLGSNADFYFLSETIPKWKANLPLNSTVSVFSLCGKANGVKFTGFRYSIPSGVLNSSSLGLSNVSVKRKVEVSLRKGQLLIIMQHNGFDSNR